MGKGWTWKRSFSEVTTRAAALVSACLSLGAWTDAKPPAHHWAMVPCDLANREFCGTYDRTGRGGGKLAIHGTRWYWENGDTLQCRIVTESRRNDRIFSVLACTHFFATGKQSDVKFYMLQYVTRETSEIEPDSFVYKFWDKPKVYLFNTHELACLFSRWSIVFFDYDPDRHPCPVSREPLHHPVESP